MVDIMKKYRIDSLKAYRNIQIGLYLLAEDMLFNAIKHNENKYGHSEENYITERILKNALKQIGSR